MIFDFSVYFNYLSRITFGGWGTTSKSLRCLKGHVPLRVGDYFQALKVSEGTCAVLRTYLHTKRSPTKRGKQNQIARSFRNWLSDKNSGRTQRRITN